MSDQQQEQSAYPLCWPPGWPRTAAHARVWGHFKGTPDKVRREMISEILALMSSAFAGRESVIISTNMPLRRDGEPISNRSEPADPGVAVYFRRKGKPMCFACDKFDRVWKNMRAIQKTIEALRGIDRWGSSQMMERAFTGFAALHAPSSDANNCWTVLEIPFASSPWLIEQAYRDLSKVRHPDRGGTHEAMAALNKAREEALAAVKGKP